MESQLLSVARHVRHFQLGSKSEQLYARHCIIPLNNQSTYVCSEIIRHYHIYPTPPLGQNMTQGQLFKRSLTGLNSQFSFSKTSCLTKAEEPSLPYYLPIAGRRIIGFIPFPRVLVLCEMHSVQDLNSCHRVQFRRR